MCTRARAITPASFSHGPSQTHLDLRTYLTIGIHGRFVAPVGGGMTRVYGGASCRPSSDLRGLRRTGSATLIGPWAPHVATNQLTVVRARGMR